MSMIEPPGSRFAGWLQASMHNRGLSQAQLARSVGVADTQISRWRRGQAVPTVLYLQRLADAFGIQRVTLDQLVGLPVAPATSASAEADPEKEAELQAYQVRLRAVMQGRLPRNMWRAYVEACVALAEGLSTSAARAVRESLADASTLAATDDGTDGDDERHTHEPPPERPLGFRP
jgi:transcriptional regulator with XRE-family HTH domain